MRPVKEGEREVPSWYGTHISDLIQPVGEAEEGRVPLHRKTQQSSLQQTQFGYIIVPADASNRDILYTNRELEGSSGNNCSTHSHVLLCSRK